MKLGCDRLCPRRAIRAPQRHVVRCRRCRHDHHAPGLTGCSVLRSRTQTSCFKMVLEIGDCARNLVFLLQPRRLSFPRQLIFADPVASRVDLSHAVLLLFTRSFVTAYSMQGPNRDVSHGWKNYRRFVSSLPKSKCQHQAVDAWTVPRPSDIRHITFLAGPDVWIGKHWNSIHWPRSTNTVLDENIHVACAVAKRLAKHVVHLTKLSGAIR